MRIHSGKAKSSPSLLPVIAATKRLWRQYHLTYDQTYYVAKAVRRALAIERSKSRRRGLLIKTLFQTGVRVSELMNTNNNEALIEEQMILISKAKGGKSRYVPILPPLAHDLTTHPSWSGACPWRSS